MNFQMFKLDFKKSKEPEIKLPTSVGSSKEQESSRKTSTSALLTTPKPLTVDHNKLENYSRDGNARPPYLRNLYAGQGATVKTGHGTMNWIQIRKGEHQGCISIGTLLIQFTCRLHHAKCQAG